jgi:hypothetical protein
VLGGGNIETVMVGGCVGLAILLEKTCEGVEVNLAVGKAVEAVEAGEVGEASDVVDATRLEVTTVVSAGSVGRGATAAMPRVVETTVKGGEDVDIEVLDAV